MSGGGPNAPGASFSGAGLVTESGSDASGYADSSASTLAADGSWQPTGGSDWSSASGFTQWGYTASGAYGYAIDGGAVSGDLGPKRQRRHQLRRELGPHASHRRR